MILLITYTGCSIILWDMELDKKVKMHQNKGQITAVSFIGPKH